MKRAAIAFFSLVLLLVPVFFILHASNPPKRFEGNAMTIGYCVLIGEALTDRDCREIESVIQSTFSEINNIYNDWNPNSEISHLNQLPAFEKAPLSSELAAFLLSIEKIVIQTEGLFDPTISPLQHVWKAALKENTLPQSEMLAALAPAIGWDKIHIENGFFWKIHPLTSLDLGGIAKGYAVDLLAQRIAQAGFKHIYVEWGGEIRTVGSHPDHRPWKIGIAGHKTIELKDAAIATSGTYVQNWSVEGTNYTHIIHPHTKTPLHNCPMTSVSVVAPTCTEADALATALMLFPSKEAALQWAEERNIQAIIW